MSTSSNKKRELQSPLSGDEDNQKRRAIGEHDPILVALDEISEDDDQAAAESGLNELLRQEKENRPDPDGSMAKKVDSLIGRMDCFMNCFADLHATVSKNQRLNDKKFKHLESTHNEFAVRITKSASSNKSRIESLEAQLKETKATNSALVNRLTKLEEDQAHKSSLQRQVNEQHSNEINDLKIEQGFTKKNVLDCFSAVKKRNLIISGVNETTGEDTTAVALGCINEVIGAAIALKNPDSQVAMRKLQRSSIDNVFRIFYCKIFSAGTSVMSGLKKFFLK